MPDVFRTTIINGFVSPFSKSIWDPVTVELSKDRSFLPANLLYVEVRAVTLPYICDRRTLRGYRLYGIKDLSTLHPVLYSKKSTDI